MKKKGLFITFEGGEGAGKSTQLRCLQDYLAGRGVEVVATREPGGTEAGENIRRLLMTGAPGRWSHAGEALLNYAARDCHLREVIRPALARGSTVLCDRFVDSTWAYQAYPADEAIIFQLVKKLEELIVGDTRPDLTFILDIDPAVGLTRANQRSHGNHDRFERKTLAFHQRVREGFLAIAREQSGRCVVVDATRSQEDISAQIIGSVKTLLAS